ncbi:glycosylated lysosomal membrane protein [Scomber scombrus]|uniref:glycosylated lysosomal membrane protein n=1 Tax=Scomber scombrus TaxID=13677 RepID=UPI002DDC7880|nr:glycosylated lysosomal membrane protein [Scomber scombrus]
MMAAVKTNSCRVSSLFFLFSVFSLSQSLFNGGETFRRKLEVVLNPGRLSPPGGDLLHVRAVGDNDTLHYLFCSQGAPTLLLVHTNTTNSTLKVDWDKFLERNVSGSLKVEPESSIVYSKAVVVSRLFEYDDVNDTAEATSDLFPPYDLQNVSWSRMNLSGSSALLCSSALNNGSLCLQLSVFAEEGRDQPWPRLLHTGNSSQLAVWLDGVLPRATRSRFLLELQAVGGANPLNSVEVKRSIDDEYSPSVFQVSQWMSNSSEVGGFVQWRPVAYRRSSPALEEVTPCRHSSPRRPSDEAAVSAASGLIKAFYDEPETFALNVSFGLSGEPFYNSTRFLRWTVLVGVGAPPMDTFSPLVLAIMAVGLGTPMILLLLGGVYVCIRKRAAPSAAGYDPIN